MLSTETIAIAAATIVGPVAAVLITRWNDKRAQRRERLMHIFRVLMATRRMTVSQEHVAAINLIEVEFHGVQPVIQAWSDYIAHLNGATAADAVAPAAWDDRRAQLLSVLLARIAARLGITKGEIDILRGGYAPSGWVEKEVRLTAMQEYVVRLSQGHAVMPVSIQQPPPPNPYPPPPA
jgi:hypothetical protein